MTIHVYGESRIHTLVRRANSGISSNRGDGINGGEWNHQFFRGRKVTTSVVTEDRRWLSKLALALTIWLNRC